ncbi:MAG: flagellin [Vicinamibacterales bacterium]
MPRALREEQRNGFFFSRLEHLRRERPVESDWHQHEHAEGYRSPVERLRINQSGDDAAGLALANSYRNTQAILSQGVRNANDGLSVLQIKDGAIANISTLLDRLSTLATQSANASSDVDRTALDNEFQDVLGEIDREANVAGLDTSGGFSVFISNDSADGWVNGTIGAADTTALGLTGSNFDITTAAHAATVISTVATAVGTLGSTSATIGTLQNRLTFAVGLAQSQVVSNKAAESRIRDANVAEESANLTRYSILTQSGISALAQANQQSSAVLKLLG